MVWERVHLDVYVALHLCCGWGGVNCDCAFLFVFIMSSTLCACAFMVVFGDCRAFLECGSGMCARRGVDLLFHVFLHTCHGFVRFACVVISG